MTRVEIRAAILRGLAPAILFLIAAIAPAPAGATAFGPDARESTESPAEAAPAGRVLSQADIERYRRIFALQQTASWVAADREIAHLESPILMGHVLAERYLYPRAYRSRYRELVEWLRSYPDHPHAADVYRLARKKKPRNAVPPPAPETPRALRFSDHGFTPSVTYVSPADRPTQVRRRAAGLLRAIGRHAEAGRLGRAESLFRRRGAADLLDPVEYDIARFHLGAGHFYHGDAKSAFAYLDGATRSTRYLPYGHWMAGLAAFRNADYAAATRHFEAAAASGRLDGWDLSACAFWAARANLRAGWPEKVAPWLALAAQHAHTFYGLLATTLLGDRPPFDWTDPAMNDAAFESLASTPRGRRALALLEIGEADRAKEELRALVATRSPEIGLHVIAFAAQNDMPALALSAGAMLRQVDGIDVHAALYPVPPWEPDRGFTVDRALVYGFMRQESQFKVHAKSSAGARGLMQLMPETAGDMAKRRFGRSDRNELYDPELNIQLGQKYLRFLLQHENVGGDLLLLAAAYNGGPGNLGRWQRHARRVGVSDPLMFIEMIPARETREFVERVAANFWMYSLRMGQPTPTLDALAAGDRPIYRALGTTPQSASNDPAN